MNFSLYIILETSVASMFWQYKYFVTWDCSILETSVATILLDVIRLVEKGSLRSENDELEGTIVDDPLAESDDERPESFDDKARQKEMRKGIDLATTLERIEKNFVITDPRLPDNPIVSTFPFGLFNVFMSSFYLSSAWFTVSIFSCRFLPLIVFWSSLSTVVKKYWEEIAGNEGYLIVVSC